MGRTTAALDEIGSEFGPDATEGSYGVQMFMLQRANGELEGIRPLIDGTEGTDDHWGPGLLAVYTELGLREPAARVLAELLGRIDVYPPASAQWASVLAFMTEAAVLLDDADAAARLRPLAAPHTGHNLVAGQFVAVFGSADRYIGQLDSLLGADTAEHHFERALAMDRRMGAALHQAETLRAWCRHVERHGAGDTRRADHLRAEATMLANHVRSILMKIGAPNRTRGAIYAVDHGLIGDGAARRVPGHPTSPTSRPLHR